MKKVFLVVCTVMFLAASFTSCREKSTGEKVEDAVEDVADDIEDAVD
jgi:predicted small secreted protein